MRLSLLLALLCVFHAARTERASDQDTILPPEISDALRKAAKEAKASSAVAEKHEKLMKTGMEKAQKAAETAKAHLATKQQLAEAASKAHQAALAAEQAQQKAAWKSSELNLAWQASIEKFNQAQKDAQGAEERHRQGKDQVDALTAKLEKLKLKVASLKEAEDVCKVKLSKVDAEVDQARIVAEAAGEIAEKHAQLLQDFRKKKKVALSNLRRQTDLAEKASNDLDQAHVEMSRATAAFEEAKLAHEDKQDLYDAMQWLMKRVQAFYRSVDDLVASMRQSANVDSRKPWERLKSNRHLKSVLKDFNTVVLAYGRMHEIDPKVYELVEPSFHFVKEASKFAIRGECDPVMELEHMSAAYVSARCGAGLWKAVGMKMERLSRIIASH